jgi:hypothetical protein
MSVTIYERASRYIARMDAAVSGGGGHDATFAVACALVHGFSLGESEAMSLMQEYNSRCAPPWSERELAYKLRSAAGSSSSKGSGYLLGENRKPETGNLKPEWKPVAPAEKVEFDPAALAALAGDFRPRLDWFAARSYADPSLLDSAGFLSLLYAGEKVLIFSDDRSQGQALWPDEPIPACGPRGMWYLANPVDGREYPNPRTGKPSRRSEESVTRWKFALLESDEADPRIWLGALAKTTLPVSAIYSSGGRSVHALIRVPGSGTGMSALSGPTSKSEWDAWARAQKATLARIGADPKALTAVRLTRLPQQYRPEKGALQKLLYVNPWPPFGERIIDRPPVRDALRDAVEAARAAAWGEDADLMLACAERLEFYAPCNGKFSPMAEELRRDAGAIHNLKTK